MAYSRYENSPKINAGKQLGTSNSVMRIRAAIKAGSIPIVNEIVTTGAERLDILAGQIYGDSRYWWILAAASDIGWGLQIPPDTVIKIPRLSDVMTYNMG